MKRKIYSPQMIASCRTHFLNLHAKFIHGSPLCSADLDKDVELNGKQLKIVGVNDDKLVVLHEEATNFIYVCEPHQVKNALPVSETEIKSTEEENTI